MCYSPTLNSPCIRLWYILGSSMAKIRILSSRGRYVVVCSRGTVSRASDLINEHSRRGKIFFLSSPPVWNYWGRKLTAKSRGQRKAIILFDDSEPAKRLATVEKI